jgi:hypothetical protein
MKINNERLEHQSVLAKLREWSNKLGTVMCLKGEIVSAKLVII